MNVTGSPLSSNHLAIGQSVKTSMQGHWSIPEGPPDSVMGDAIVQP
ncbi:MAG: hypothetical protein WDN69_37625 [Aliidongia sp.]